MDFIDLCKHGNLQKIQEYYCNYYNDFNKILDISADNESAFVCACDYGHLELAQWLLEMKPDIDISAGGDDAFCFACYNGHLKVAQWLLHLKPTIDVFVYNNCAFGWACKNGHLAVAQWLVNLKPELNISDNNEYAFRYACKNGHLEVAQWLQSIIPNKYIITIQDGEIIDWKIKYQINYDDNNSDSKNINILEKEKDKLKDKLVCGICYENDVNIESVNCQHQFCEGCIILLFDKSTNKCPYCRVNMVLFIKIT
jgi:ankyrin repeat protein